MSVPDVSVVIPTFNRRRLLQRAIESIEDQVCSAKIEVIICDDGSTDGTGDYVSQLNSPMNLRYLSNESNLGGSAARNRALRAASGHYVAFLDDDDVWHPEKLEKSLQSLGKGTHQAVVTGLFRVFADGTRLTVTPTPEQVRLPSLLARPVVGAGSSLVISREILQEIGLFDEELPRYQDWDLMVRAASHTAIGIVGEPLLTKESTGLAGLAPAEAGRIRFLEKHSKLIESLPDRDRKRVLGTHHLHLFRLALAHRRFDRAGCYALAACKAYPRFVLSVAKSMHLAFSGKKRLSTSSISARSISRSKSPRE